MPTGWRKASPALVQAEHLAEAGAAVTVNKSRAVVAVKRVAACIGLKAADLLLLDTLAAFTQPQDWEAGRRPIVWPSNAYLMEQTGFSLSTLKRHARRLAEMGVIAFQDSPNGKRWGRRDAKGVIIEAYGFDLSPLGARVEEFEALAADRAAERGLCQQLKRQITIARRRIRARLEIRELHRDGGGLREAFDALVAQLPSPRASSEVLKVIVERFLDLLHRVETMLRADPQSLENTPEAIRERQEMTPREAGNGPHIQTTNQLHSVKCKGFEKEHDETGTHDQQAEASVQAVTRCETTREPCAPRMGIDLPMILQACPEFTSWGRDLGGHIRGWPDFVRLAGKLRPMVGVSEHVWHRAQSQLGKPAAAAAFALVFEKVHSGHVASPSGYLRGMVEKAEAGELHLERSFFGRLSARAA
ncbi:plasmid replication protein RepC [Sulfitobacter sp. JB4-11]|uniref:plasmid replication protein RepC n=1 Tax=Sulfitobacter rhodophyticola TaxID=3238304 RepID=UPI003D818B30